MTEQEWNEREKKAKQFWMSYVALNDLPEGIPPNPDEVYADQGWKGWYDFFGEYI